MVEDYFGKPKLLVLPTIAKEIETSNNIFTKTYYSLALIVQLARKVQYLMKSIKE